MNEGRREKNRRDKYSKQKNSCSRMKNLSQKNPEINYPGELQSPEEFDSNTNIVRNVKG